jgi:hypothetical protein
VAEVSGFFVACAVVTLVQFLRLRDRRLLALLVLFTLRALSSYSGELSFNGKVADLLAGAAGLALLYWLSPRPPQTPGH